jgi:hypothetical protein
MDALAALQAQTNPSDKDAALLQQMGIISTTSSSTTTNPYSQSVTDNSAILQRLTELGTKIDNMGAQIMGKLSNTPVALKGGRRRKTRRHKTRHMTRK